MLHLSSCTACLWHSMQPAGSLSSLLLASRWDGSFIDRDPGATLVSGLRSRQGALSDERFYRDRNSAVTLPAAVTRKLLSPNRSSPAGRQSGRGRWASRLRQAHRSALSSNLPELSGHWRDTAAPVGRWP